MFKYIREDIKNIVKKDPAARNGLEVLLCYPGIWALIFHKPAHFLYRHRVKLIARMISQFARFLTGIEIHPGAKIGRRCFIDHGMGIVIGETAEIGDDSKIGSGSVVLKEVPPGSTVVGIPGIVVKNKFGELTEDMDQVSIPDPIAVELECLRKRVVQLEEHLSATLGDKLEIFRVDESCEICQGRDIDEEKFDGRAETQIDDMMDEECEKQDDR